MPGPQDLETTNSETKQERTYLLKLRHLGEVLRHPFILFVIGATTTSLLIPYLNAKVNHNQLLQEARLKKAVEIADRNTEFNSKFNTLKTLLESFHNRSVRLQLSPAEFSVAHSKFIDDFNRRYLELDERTWWWYSAIEREAAVLQLISPTELQALDAEFKEYAKNLNDSFNILRPLWQALTSREYKPDDKRSTDKVDAIIADVNRQIGVLFEARNTLVQRIARHFGAPQ